MTKRKVIVISLLYFLGLVIVVIIVHEIGHIVAALFIGVPFNEIEIGLYGINPSMTLPERFASGNLAIYHYAGGLTAAGILIVIYLLYWHRRFKREPSVINWTMGAITIVIAGMQLAQGYIEGRLHVAYIYYSGTPLNPLQIICLSLIIASALIHFVIFPRSRIQR